MSYEVDVIAVGKNSESGDAIAIRFGDFINYPESQKVVIIDGGFKDSGQALVNRIKNEYGTNIVDLVISTHPDNDHISGLEVVINNLYVKELWMHQPWNLSENVHRMSSSFKSSSMFREKSKLEISLEAAFALEQLALSRGIPIFEPYQGLNAFNNIIHVLGPSKDLYESLVIEFDKSAKLVSIFQKMKRKFSEIWDKDELVEPEDNSVSPRNNSSVITLINLEKTFLFTGDAGVLALNHAADYADRHNYSIKEKVHYQQIPHHGSKRNVGPSILDRLIGPILTQGYTNSKSVFISAAKEGMPKHPSNRVTNALNRRGSKVLATQGSHHCYRSLDIPIRETWGRVTPIPFIPVYDEED